MGFKRIIYGIFLFTLVHGYANAQDKKTERIFKRLILPDRNLWETKAFKDKAFLFAVIIGVDSKGKPDTVFFQNGRDDHLMKLIDFEKIKSSLLRSSGFKQYKNKCLVLLVSIIRDEQENYTINNGNELLGHWKEIHANLLNRTNLFLPPLILSSANNH